MMGPGMAKGMDKMMEDDGQPKKDSPLTKPQEKKLWDEFFG